MKIKKIGDLLVGVILLAVFFSFFLLAFGKGSRSVDYLFVIPTSVLFVVTFLYAVMPFGRKTNHDCEHCKEWSEHWKKKSEDYKKLSEGYAKRCLCGGKEKEARG